MKKKKKPIDEYLMKKDEIISCPVCSERMFAIARNIRIEDDVHLDKDFIPIDLRYRHYFDKAIRPPCINCGSDLWWENFLDALHTYNQLKLKEEGAFDGIEKLNEN
jgi:DNA-directed RNA polymerase subunit RPC12/RpoP|tara:strand:- start:823 stop:1140 length:318 start_codon:yes stop_codon:yes gene_type:complete